MNNDYTKGFGTNFHQVYAENAKIYNDFSAAEIFSDELSQKLQDLFFGKTAIDIGCGTCHKTNMFSDQFDQMYALDTSKELLSFARNKYSSNNKLNFIVASAAQIPLLDDSVDTVVSTWASIPLEEAIAEMKRICRNGGNIIRIGTTMIDDFTTMFPKYSLDRVQYVNEYFRNQGFTEEIHDVLIQFTDLDSAKNILSIVLGINPEVVTEKEYIHKVVLHYLQGNNK